ncbi:MAG: aminopeptidase P family protein [Candidatus Taylorbacteria bacterium]|nr:aminopeptidase P family protein [Candidatus Taylorbacteria bacterium]
MTSALVKIRKVLAEKKAVVFWLPNHEKSGQPATRYLSGFAGTDSHILITKNRAYFLTDSRYLTNIEKRVKGYTILDVSRQKQGELLKKLLPQKGKGRVLIDGSVISVSSAENARNVAKNIEVVNVDGLLKHIRQVKTLAEIKLLRKAASISCKAFALLLPHIKTGVTEKKVAETLKRLLEKCGAEGLSFEPIIASGKNAALPHAVPTNKKIKSGELVVIDFGVLYRGYVSDMTRTVAIGRISDKLNEMYEAVREAQEAGCAQMRAGLSAQTIDATCRSILKKHKLDQYFTHATGHGIGMEVHELPIISSKATNLLQVNEVVTCEPGVYIAGLGGVRIEDSLVVTEKGSQNLTSSVEKKLIVL